ncbi:MAG: ACP S-malonyltransferase [Bacteroidales bacterium]|nr:ACP S-malonyltransferase [Bacteroidales bacterium]
MNAVVFPGQGSQFKGMGKELYETSTLAKELFDSADAILGYRISEVMFEGSDEELKQTRITQPAIFLHSVISALSMGEVFRPDMAAGHSLGEFSALTACGCLGFEDGLRLVYARAMAMQECCEKVPGAMAAILALNEAVIEDICARTEGVVVAANYNCPGQVVISGEVRAVQEACERLKEAGARRALILPVGGAFHSPLMEPAREQLSKAIGSTTFKTPICPVYQNVDARPHTDPEQIKANLLAQLTAPVRWTETVRNMASDGMTEYMECGPGKVLTGLIGKTLQSIRTETGAEG